MKKVNKLFLLVLGFAAGLLSGAFIRLGFEIINGRPSAIGGEALILPLIVLLLSFGFALGKEARVQRKFHRTYQRGYHDGFEDGKQDFSRRVRAIFQAPASIQAASDRTGR